MYFSAPRRLFLAAEYLQIPQMIIFWSLKNNILPPELCKFAVWTKAPKAPLSVLSAGRSGRTGQDTSRVSCPSTGSNLSGVLSVHLPVCVFRGGISAARHYSRELFPSVIQILFLWDAVLVEAVRSEVRDFDCWAGIGQVVGPRS